MFQVWGSPWELLVLPPPDASGGSEEHTQEWRCILYGMLTSNSTKQGPRVSQGWWPQTVLQLLGTRSCWSHAHSPWGCHTSFLSLRLECFFSWTCHSFPLSPVSLNSCPWIPSHCDTIWGRRGHASSCYSPNLLRGALFSLLYRGM